MTDLLEGVAEEKAASNRRIAQKVEAASKEAEGDGGTLRRRIARNAREATRFAVGAAKEDCQLWQSIREWFEDGLERSVALRVLVVTQNLFDSWFTLADTCRECWAVAERLGARADGLEELDKAQASVQQARATYEAIRAFLTREHKPVDPAVLAKAREDMRQGHFKTPEQILSQFGNKQQ